MRSKGKFSDIGSFAWLWGKWGEIYQGGRKARTHEIKVHGTFRSGE